MTIIDNLSLRNIDNELEAGSLPPTRPMGTRLKAWKEAGGRAVAYERLDIASNYHRLLTLIGEQQPGAIIHFAEQRAAPYSMKSSWHKRHTVNNNLSATHNTLAPISMGVHG